MKNHVKKPSAKFYTDYNGLISICFANCNERFKHLNILIWLDHIYTLHYSFPLYISLVWPVPLAQVLPRSKMIFSSKTWFFLELIWIFSGRNHFKKSIFATFWIQILPNKNSIKILLIKIFPTTPKVHSNSSKKIQLWFILIFNEEIIQYSRTFALQLQASWNQANAPLLLESFPLRISLLERPLLWE
jgi:hypothetical protein